MAITGIGSGLGGPADRPGVMASAPCAGDRTLRRRDLGRPGGDEHRTGDRSECEEARTDREGHGEPVDDAGLGGRRAVGDDVAGGGGRRQGVEQRRAQ